MSYKICKENANKHTLRVLGFNYSPRISDEEFEGYEYSFPIYFYKKTPILWCNIRLWLNNRRVNIDVVDSNNNYYSAFYVADSKVDHDVLKVIDRRVFLKLKEFGITKG